MSHDKGFENTFRKGDIDIFQDKLVDLSNMLIGFYTYYNQIPEWKRYLISWKDTQDRLSDQAVTILEGPPVLNAQKFDRTKFVFYSISAYRPAAWPETGHHSLKGRGAWRFDFPPPQDTPICSLNSAPLPLLRTGSSGHPNRAPRRRGPTHQDTARLSRRSAMKRFQLPHIGMRTTKTAVAVMLSYLIFVPFGLLYNESYPGVLAYVGPAYSCIACIVCMQSSLEQTLQVGLSRFVGVFIGAVLGWPCCFWSPCSPTGRASS